MKGSKLVNIKRGNMIELVLTILVSFIGAKIGEWFAYKIW